jgi:LacI family transcriptional regulator
MSKKRPTIHDVARLAGVSIKTVSRVFNHEPNVRQATHDRVVNAAEMIDYRPNQSARRLAANRAFVIGMLYDNPNADYVTEVQYGSLEVCRKNGYSLLIQPYQSDSPGLIDDVVDLQRQVTVDGFVVLQPLSDHHGLIHALISRDIPAVRVSQRPYEGLPWISVGDREAADDMTEYLLNLGHRRIGFIMGHPEHGSSHDRLDGYRSALIRRKIEFDEALVESGLFDYQSGYSCAQRLLQARSRPTAVFASNDHMALGVLTAAHEMGLRIPEDLSVAGFDDISMARFAWPPLTTVRQPIAQVAEVATEVLLGRLQGRNEESTDHRLNAEIVRRESTGAAS